jgi:glucose/arabinose dehydrogenase
VTVGAAAKTAYHPAPVKPGRGRVGHAFGVLALVVGIAACSGGDDNGGSTATTSSATGISTASSAAGAPTTAPRTGPTARTGGAPTTTAGAPLPAAEKIAAIKLTTQPFSDVDKVTGFVTDPASSTIYVSSQTGQVYKVAHDGSKTLALDIHSAVPPYTPGSERGLLGLGFSTVGWRMFVFYSDLQNNAHLVSYAMKPDGTANASTRRAVIDVPSTGLGHKGGGMSFDGSVLYLALGDGGGTNGRDAQNYESLLGSIIRIVPRTTGPGYDFPNDNPYVKDPSKRPELWAKGLREPWGFWRDPITGNLWTADVGNHTMEEIDRMAPEQEGFNFGWPFVEGTQVHHPGAPPHVTAPLFAYRHDEVGPAAIGGRVYRGSAIPALDGAYVFADMAGTVFGVGAGDQVTKLTLHLSGVVTGFGIGPDGELYATTHTEGVKRIAPA